MLGYGQRVVVCIEYDAIMTLVGLENGCAVCLYPFLCVGLLLLTSVLMLGAYHESNSVWMKITINESRFLWPGTYSK